MNISVLVGMTLFAVENKRDSIVFTADSARVFKLYHDQDCCEDVSVEDVIGDLQDLVGSPILQAREVSSEDTPAKEACDDSFTWTFYKLATIKGSVTIRFYGTSNGYYSESVEFAEIKGAGK